MFSQVGWEARQGEHSLAAATAVTTAGPSPQLPAARAKAERSAGAAWADGTEGLLPQVPLPPTAPPCSPRGHVCPCPWQCLGPTALPVHRWDHPSLARHILPPEALDSRCKQGSCKWAVRLSLQRACPCLCAGPFAAGSGHHSITHTLQVLAWFTGIHSSQT